ncbi:bifunctional 3'-5' exonuclease/DNA polymerase [Rhodococcus sp. 3Y1]
MGADARLDLLIAAIGRRSQRRRDDAHGLPFSTQKHRELLEERLGPRPTGYDLPARMQELAAQISEVFGRTVNPSSSVEITEAFGRQGIELPSTRKWFLQEIDHPAVPLLLRHRELAKLYSTNGWQWMDSWVRGDRFRPIYVPGGVVSGRWASRGGGALQIPKTMRSSVVADPGHVFVVADAGQLEPRILAAMSGDRRMMAAAGDDDLYALVGAEAFGGDRAKAKVAILGVLYGATAGEAKALLVLLRKRFPVAVEYVEQAAKAGERGEVVKSLLGRACPHRLPTTPTATLMPAVVSRETSSFRPLRPSGRCACSPTSGAASPKIRTASWSSSSTTKWSCIPETPSQVPPTCWPPRLRQLDCCSATQSFVFLWTSQPARLTAKALRSVVNSTPSGSTTPVLRVLLENVALLVLVDCVRGEP